MLGCNESNIIFQQHLGNSGEAMVEIHKYSDPLSFVTPTNNFPRAVTVRGGGGGGGGDVANDVTYTMHTALPIRFNYFPSVSAKVSY